jgi:DNA-binding IclR family transcriptional regulator
MSEKKLNSVDAVKVSVRILDSLALAHRAMGVTELAEQLSETKPRIHRHLATLKEVGLIEQDNANERYRLGWRMFQLGEAAGNQFDLRRRAEPYLVQLRDELRETVVLTVATNGMPMVISTMENIYARICVSVKPGNRPPPHRSALGRVSLAFASPRERDAMLDEVLASGVKFDAAALTELSKRLDRIRADYYEICSGEMMTGISTLAVPIFRDGASLAGSIAIVGSVDDIPTPPDGRQIKALQRVARELSEQLNSMMYSERAGAPVRR